MAPLTERETAMYEALRALAGDFEARFEQRQPIPRHLGRTALNAAREVLRRIDGVDQEEK